VNEMRERSPGMLNWNLECRMIKDERSETGNRKPEAGNGNRE